MAMGDRISPKAEELQVRGQQTDGKQTAGDGTGDDDLKADGEKDEAEATLKQAGEKMKDAVTS